MGKYPIYIFWSDDDRTWIATAPDLPGCRGDGLSPREAVNDLNSVMLSWFEGARVTGVVPPLPFSNSASDIRPEPLRMPVEADNVEV